jgi:hypothetical protein
MGSAGNVADTWQIRLKSAAGALVALIDDYDSFTFTRRVNGMGAFALRMNGNDAKAALFELDGQIEFWRADAENGIPWYREFAGVQRNWDYYVRENGALIFEPSGRGYVDLLNRRVIAAASGSVDASKAGAAETVQKAFVDKQAGPGAGARAITGLTVEADGAHGNSVTMGRAYRKLLEITQEIAAIGGGDFDVEGTGVAACECRWYTGQRGTDRHTTVVFSLELGNMAQPKLSYSRADEVNAVLVGGQGEKSTRTTVWRTDATLIDDSPWNRIEEFADARNEDTTAGLNAVGDRVLAEKKPRVRLTFDALQIPACLYGKHYFLGDLVGTKFLTYTGTKKVQAVEFTVDQGGTTIKPEMADA